MAVMTGGPRWGRVHYSGMAECAAMADDANGKVVGQKRPKTAKNSQKLMELRLF